MFIIYSLVWMACDAIFMKPVAILLHRLGVSRNVETCCGLAEVSIGIGLGSIAGLVLGAPMIAFAFSNRLWSWVATAGLIISSIVVSGTGF